MIQCATYTVTWVMNDYYERSAMSTPTETADRHLTGVLVTTDYKIQSLAPETGSGECQTCCAASSPKGRPRVKQFCVKTLRKCVTCNEPATVACHWLWRSPASKYTTRRRSGEGQQAVPDARRQKASARDGMRYALHVGSCVVLLNFYLRSEATVYCVMSTSVGESFVIRTVVCSSFYIPEHD